MRLLIIATTSAVFLLMAGCQTSYELSKSMVIYGYDSSKYSEKGFMFTPESYNGKYESIGLIEIDLYPAVTKDEKSSKDDYWNRSSWVTEKISGEEILDSLYNYTKNMGANAVVNLKITETKPVSNGAIYFTGIKATGFAIKRENINN